MLKKILNLNNWLLIISLPVSLSLVLLIILVKPFILIRTGYLLTYRFGHSIKDLEMYLTERALYHNKSNIYDIFILSINPANSYIQKISKKHLKIYPYPIIYPVHYIFKKLKNIKFFKKHFIEMRNYDYDYKNYFDKLGHQINLPYEDIVTGNKILEKIGIYKNDKLVCLCVRDENYSIKNLNQPSKKDKRTVSFMDIRNSNVENYKLASLKLNSLGYKIIRVGKDTKDKISYENENIIDYSKSSIRSDFMDIFLAFRCNFAIGDSAGWTQAPIVFRKFIALTNWAPYSVIDFISKNHYIFKHYYDENEKKKLTIKEIFKKNLHKLFLFDLKEQGISLIENTPEEILDMVLEVESKVSGKKNLSDIDNFQMKFRNFLKEQRFFSRQDNDEISKDLKVEDYSIKRNFGEKFLKKNFK